MNVFSPHFYDSLFSYLVLCTKNKQGSEYSISRYTVAARHNIYTHILCKLSLRIHSMQISLISDTNSKPCTLRWIMECRLSLPEIILIGNVKK